MEGKGVNEGFEQKRIKSHAVQDGWVKLERPAFQHSRSSFSPGGFVIIHHNQCRRKDQAKVLLHLVCGQSGGTPTEDVM